MNAMSLQTGEICIAQRGIPHILKHNCLWVNEVIFQFSECRMIVILDFSLIIQDFLYILMYSLQC